MKILSALLVLTLSGCAAHPNLVGLRGNAVNTNYSLQDRRAAKTSVKNAPAPIGAKQLGEISVERCHQYAQDEQPSDETLTDDLILRAYSDGADGLTNVKIQREPAILKNCWHLARATASIYKSP